MPSTIKTWSDEEFLSWDRPIPAKIKHLLSSNASTTQFTGVGRIQNASGNANVDEGLDKVIGTKSPTLLTSIHYSIVFLTYKMLIRILVMMGRPSVDADSRNIGKGTLVEILSDTPHERVVTGVLDEIEIVERKRAQSRRARHDRVLAQVAGHVRGGRSAAAVAKNKHLVAGHARRRTHRALELSLYPVPGGCLRHIWPASVGGAPASGGDCWAVAAVADLSAWKAVV